MSPEVVAVLVGVVVGFVLDRIARYLGFLWCEPSDWELKFIAPTGRYGEHEDIGAGRAQEAEYLEYSFSLAMFNGRDMPTGLRDITVVLICDGDELVSTPDDRASMKVNLGLARYEAVQVINLPPRQWVHRELRGLFDIKEGVTAGEWRQAVLVGRRPSYWRKTFRKGIAKS